MSEPLRAGVIGCGEQAGYLMRHAWQRVGGIEVVACFDQNPDTATRFARTYNLTPADSIEGMMRGLDLVAVCTPPIAHPDNVIDALAAADHGRVIGIHCEKPSALDISGHDAMTRAAAARGAVLTFGYDRLFSAVGWIAELLGNGVFGRLDLIVGKWHRFAGIPKRGAFLDRRRSGGGPGFDLFPHLAAAGLFIAGAATFSSVAAVTGRRILEAGGTLGTLDPGRATVEDSIHGMAMLTRPRGLATMLFSIAWDLPVPADRFRLDVAGTRGSATLRREPLVNDDERYVALAWTTPERARRAPAARWEARRVGDLVELRPSAAEPTLAECRSAQLADLATTVRARRAGRQRETLVTPQFARNVLQLVLAAYGSAARDGALTRV